MQRWTRAWIPAAAFLVIAAGDALSDDAPRRVFTADAVALLRDGKEVQGSQTYASMRNGYTYWFANAANQAAFERDPEKYEIQLGGACARMGLLSGEGRCDIHTVYRGKLYLFASPQCRDGFLKGPEKLLETDDPPVAADADARRRGAELVELAVRAHGGAAAIDDVRTYRQRLDSQAEFQGEKVRNDHVYMMAFPDRAREESYWGVSLGAHCVAGDRGAFATEAGIDRRMVPAQVRAARRQMNHQLLTILKSRQRPDFVAAALGPGQDAAAAVERVAVFFDGTTTTLGIEPTSGRVRTLAYRGLGGPRYSLGTIEKTFVAWTTEAGVLLPTHWTVTFDGEPARNQPAPLTRVEINPQLPEALFTATE